MTQPLVQPGGEFTYDFVLTDAGTYWYHPHADSAAQVGWGLYGPIVVTDPADPKAFGDDLVLMMSDMSLDPDGQLLPKDDGGNFGDLFGREGRALLINGRVMPTLQVRQGKQQRWRVINASRSRYWTFALRNNTFISAGRRQRARGAFGEADARHRRAGRTDGPGLYARARARQHDAIALAGLRPRFRHGGGSPARECDDDSQRRGGARAAGGDSRDAAEDPAHRHRQGGGAHAGADHRPERQPRGDGHQRRAHLAREAARRARRREARVDTRSTTPRSTIPSTCTATSSRCSTTSAFRSGRTPSTCR